MNKYIKDALGVAGIVLGVAVCWSVITYADSYSKSIQPSSFRSFTVSADGDEVTVPDVAEFTFSVITEGGKDLGALQGDNTSKVNKGVEFVKSQGVEAKDITTSGYSVSPRYETSNCYSLSMDGRVCPPPAIVGYTVTSTVSVKARDFTKVGSILSGVVDNGANSVSELQFVIDDPSIAEAKAKEKAIEKAKVKAKDLSKAAGFNIGRLLSVSEGSGYYPSYRSAAYDMAGSAKVISAAPAPVIEPGSQKVNVSVTLTYEIR
ncbi:MAG: SIMPL domain-containing protein [Candidatus Colwellbacteria bacterium]|nr:SIMPL domain-containing protein [Candidatus Colwellbacteria bacterium]